MTESPALGPVVGVARRRLAGIGDVDLDETATTADGARRRAVPTTVGAKRSQRSQ
ncbi:MULTISPECIES: hypothetical protein [unclassified Streptomyces]|uniref:hypothetical protein n=1 Tax=unclassified Streptomyces TaxID=2593676 RepID=UPI00352D8909